MSVISKRIIDNTSCFVGMIEEWKGKWSFVQTPPLLGGTLDCSLIFIFVSFVNFVVFLKIRENPCQSVA